MLTFDVLATVQYATLITVLIVTIYAFNVIVFKMRQHLGLASSNILRSMNTAVLCAQPIYV